MAFKWVANSIECNENKGQMKIEEWRWICILNFEHKRRGWRLMLQYLRDSVTHISFSSLLENNIGILS